MKTKSIAVFAAFALPFVLNAQTTGGSASSSGSSSEPSSSSSAVGSGSSSSGSSNSSGSRSSSDRSYGSSSNSSPTGSAASSNRSGMYDSSSGSRSNQPGMSGSSSSSDLSSGQALQRVTKESLDNQLTAKNLMDKEVYDRDQKKIGKVVDVVLNGQSSSLVSAFSNGSQNSSSSDNGSSSTSGGSSTSSHNSGSSSGSQANSVYGSSAGEMAQASVIIAQGGMLKMNRDLIRAPLSQLTYDSNSKHLTLNVSSNDLTSLASNDGHSPSR